MPVRERLEIDPADGALVMQPSGHALRGGQALAEAQAAMAGLLGGVHDQGNGYVWLSLRGFDLAGMRCRMSACFHEDRLEMVLIGVDLPGAQVEDNWPTQQAIDNEIAFIRRAFGKQLGRKFGDAVERFAWGEAWSRFDPKGFSANAGVSYG